MLPLDTTIPISSRPIVSEYHFLLSSHCPTLPLDSLLTALPSPFLLSSHCPTLPLDSLLPALPSPSLFCFQQSAHIFTAFLSHCPKIQYSYRTASQFLDLFLDHMNSIRSSSLVISSVHIYSELVVQLWI